MSNLVMNRAWAMPNRATFSIPAVHEFVCRWTEDARVVIDPFCGESVIGTHRNDLVHIGGMDARRWLDKLKLVGINADAVIFDPPYSPRQIAECYRNFAAKVSKSDTQNARLYREVRERLNKLLRPGGVALSFGWNSVGFGKKLGYEQREILLVCHGGAHNDTICLAETKR